MQNHCSILSVFLLMGAATVAQDVSSDGRLLLEREDERPRPLTFSLSGNRVLDFSPDGDLMNTTKTNIPTAGKDRFGLSLGARFPLFRVHPKGNPDRGIQLDAEGAVFAQFDRERNLDSIGWDGWYGFLLSVKRSQNFVYRFAALHESSHLGDEYIENTGRTRLGYTREELEFGVSWQPRKTVRTYGEAGWGFTRNSDPQEPWRVQMGLEWQQPPVLFKGRAGWYAALDESFTQERDWNGTTVIQTGIYIPMKDSGRTHRFGIEYYNGRSPMGEFFQYNEEYVAIGAWFDM